MRNLQGSFGESSEVMYSSMKGSIMSV